MKPICIELAMPFEKLPTGSSRFWGNPDLPSGDYFPMYTDSEGDQVPYVFICQINLEELHTYDPTNPLPKQGLLQFYAKIDHYLGYFADTDCISGYISDAEDVRVLYFPDYTDFQEVVLLDEDDEPWAPEEKEIHFKAELPPLSDDHALFALPTHREWETWDEPYEDWQILLQIDSFDGMDFQLNFMDCGVLDFLIHPDDLTAARFNNVRAIVLST